MAKESVNLMKKKRGRKPKTTVAIKEVDQNDNDTKPKDSYSAIVNSVIDSFEESVKLKKKVGKFRFLSMDQSETDDANGEEIANTVKAITDNFDEKLSNFKVVRSEENLAIHDFEDKDIVEADVNDLKSIRRSARLQTKSKQAKSVLHKNKDKTKKKLQMDEQEQLIDKLNLCELIEVPEEKPIKVKSRWRQSSEQEMTDSTQNTEIFSSNVILNTNILNENPVDSLNKYNISIINNTNSNNSNGNGKTKISLEDYHQMKKFITIRENQYLTEKILCKEANEMVCDCFVTKTDDKNNDEFGCGEDCINRLLMIECGPNCSLGDLCSNKRFQKFQNAPCLVFSTEKKGLGLKVMKNLNPGDFIMEYVGEVLNFKQFEKRARQYSNENHQHYYFMALRNDTIIDATSKGNISRYINHSCDPNCETQKWTVNGELRIGFFSRKHIGYNEEITFDYQLQRYGKQAQKCYCETPSCRGWIGEEPFDDESDEEEEDEVEDIEDDENESNENLLKETQLNKKTDKPITMNIDANIKTDVQVKPKRKYTRKKVITKPTNNIMDDLDLEEGIRILSLTGLKNQLHTLNLSRLMVRATDFESRRQLLCLLRNGELPCRRLFLDYHGLQLIHSWMEHIVDQSITYPLRIEILQTLASLPIPNKSMIQDSKIFSTVEAWSKFTMDNIVKKNDLDEDEEEQQYFLDELVKIGKKLIDDWTQLKEVFRIPKKDRIEQMKEHEREANKGMNEEKNENLSRFSLHFLNQQSNKEKNYCKSVTMKTRNSPDYQSLLLKEARRKMFAKRVAREDENARKLAAKIQGMIPNQIRESSFDSFSSTNYSTDLRNGINIFNIENDPNIQKSKFNIDKNQEIHRSIQLPINIDFSVPPPNLMINRVLPLQQPKTQGQLLQQQQLVQQQVQTLLHPNVCQANIPINYSFTNNIDQISTPLQPILPSKQLQSQIFTMPAFVHLPTNWSYSFDKIGRPYYFHINKRKPQWHPPPCHNNYGFNGFSDDSTSSSEVNSVSSESSSESDNDLLMEVQRRILIIKAAKKKSLENTFNSSTKAKNRRESLVEEHLISPLSSEEKLLSSIEANRYKQTKERLKRQKEKHRKLRKLLKKQFEESSPLNENQLVSSSSPNSPQPSTSSTSHQYLNTKSICLSSFVSENDKKIKELFRSQMATEMVQFLNPYRRIDCKQGRIANNDDFKHLARKLTYFVMIKEMKQCRRTEDLVCNDSVKVKAKEFVRKYMLKYDEIYEQSNDESEDSKHEYSDIRTTIFIDYFRSN